VAWREDLWGLPLFIWRGISEGGSGYDGLAGTPGRCVRLGDGIFFMRGLHRFLFFFAGSALGLAIGDRAFAWTSLHVESAQLNPVLWRAGCAIFCSMAGGVILLWGSRWVMTLATSVIGSILIVLSVNDPLFLLALAPLIPTSFFFQMGVLRRLLPDPSRQVRLEDEYEE
jgi:hypothetical protein